MTKMRLNLAIVGFLILVFVVSCEPRSNPVKKTFSLEGNELYSYDSTMKVMELHIIKIYPAKSYCTGAEKYANLYVAKTLRGQSLYVFEYCKEVSKYAFDITGRYVPLINPERVLKEKQDSVIIFVPKGFSIPTGVKYIFAELGFLTES